MPIGFNLRNFLRPVFIETGLYKGKGVKAALRAGFRKIYSIEIADKWLAQGQRSFYKQIVNGRVTLVRGDSAVELPKLLKTIPEAACTFWLDAHTAKINSLPLVDELQAILEHPRDDHIILIDDLRVFDKWGIDLEGVRKQLYEINPKYTLRLINGFIPQDVLAAVPPKEREANATDNTVRG